MGTVRRLPALPTLWAPLLLLLSLAPAGTTGFAAERPPHPMATPDTYELHPALELSLFAREPMVIDPVALTFDEFGRAYVVEMRDYPYGFGPERRPGGTIRVLEDLDGDGRADRSVVFAEHLSFPTSVVAWNEGVLVMAPPEVLFLQDLDGDGRSDRREVMVRGIALGVTDSNANGLRWALDNWVHAVNGGNGGNVSLPRSGGKPPIALGDRDFRFRPEDGRLERTYHTGGGFGLVFDDWGRSFTPHNVNHMQQRIVDADVFGCFPGLPAFETTHSISDHGEMARIYAISTAVTRPNHPEQAGYFSSSGSMGYLGHRGWPGDLPGSLFVCDVVGNLVHRDVPSPDGPILKASRAASEQTREFFASRDHAFRPTGVEPGPDGALYLLDMQRAVIEHPDYIPKKLLETLDVRAGDDRGRIYRIAPKGWPKVRSLPGRSTVPELVASLASPDPWTRLTSQRLLVTRRPASAESELRRLATGPEALGRLHAVWSLAGLDALTESDLLAALDDPRAELRASVLPLAAERFAASANVLRSVLRRVGDPDMEVRFRAMAALGAFHAPALDPILDTFWRDREATWSRRAALAVLRPGDEARAAEMWFGNPAMARASDPGAQAAIREVADLIGARSVSDQAERLDSALRAALRPADVAQPLRVAFLEGLAEGLKRAASKPVLAESAMSVLRGSLDPDRPALLVAAWRLARLLDVPETAAQKSALEAALRTARDSSSPLARRQEATQLLEFADLEQSGPVLFGLLDGREPQALQRVALDLLRAHREPRVGEGLVRAWPGLSPSLRAPVVNLLVYRPSFHAPLLAALESGSLPVGELNLDLEHRRRLLRNGTADIRQRAAKFMSDEEYSNRKGAVDEWLGKLPPTGDAARGRPIFERICAQCHRVGALGFQVGPDLTGVRHRSVEDLLSNILDPNMAMNPVYAAFSVERKDGESETGILLAESEDAVTLVQAGGRQVSVPRSQMVQLRSEGKSLMPDGLEAGLAPADLRDVIAFLQDPPSLP